MKASMLNTPINLINPVVMPLFASPLVVTELPPDVVADINPQIRTLVYAKEQEAKGTHVSNVGGWQSDHNLTEWGGEPINIISGAIVQILKSLTMRIDGMDFKRDEIPWKVNGWANINRKGNFNVPHTHPGAYWSAVYYVDVPEDIVGQRGGEIEFFDPRGALPIMYCPDLHFGIQNYVSAGKSELHKPKEGQCIIFPSWLSHSVRPFDCEGGRISIALNYSV